MIRHPLLLLVLACLLAASGCSDGSKEVQEALPAPSPSPSPSPTPPPLQPVEGVVEVRALDASRPDKLGLADDGPPPEGSVEQAAAAVASVLDQYLHQAQQGSPDLAVLRAVWLEEANPAWADVLRTGLTTPDNPVTSAHYELVVQVEPSPTVAATSATIVRADGSTVQIELVFDLTGGDQPRLQLLGGGEAA